MEIDETAIQAAMTVNHPIAQCLDLRRLGGARFNYSWDEAYRAERPDLRQIEAPWLVILQGKYGWVFPWGGRLLAVYSSRPRFGGRSRRFLRRSRGVKSGKWDGSGGLLSGS